MFQRRLQAGFGGLGTAFGAGIYESRVVVPEWQNTPPQTWPNTGLEFWVYVTTVPLTLLTLATATLFAFNLRLFRTGYKLRA